MEGAEHRRVRGHRSEEVSLEAEVLDVRAALSTPGEHQRHLDEHLAPVMDREPLALRRDLRREQWSEPQPVRKRPKGVEPDMGHDARTTGFHTDAIRSGSVHFGSALLLSGSWFFDSSSFPDGKGFSADARRSDQEGS